MLGAIADLTWRRPKLVLATILALAVVAAALGRDVEHHLKAAGFTDSASESERATRLLRQSLGADPDAALVVLVRARGDGRLDIRSAPVRREVARLSRELAAARHVGRVVNPLEDRRARALVARDGRSLVLSAQLAAQDVEDAGGVAAADAKRRLASRTLVVGVGGFATSFDEVNDQTREDLTNAELIAFPALAVLLLLVFRGVVAAAIPLLIAGLSIVGTLLVLRIMAATADTSLFALNITTALGMGLAVDYALLLVSRYREELARDGPTRAAHRRTVMSAGRAVLFSGFTVAVALAALIAMPQRFLYSLGIAGAAVAGLSAVLTVFVVPALLRLAGSRIDALAIRRGPAVASESDRWYRVARGVMRRPVLVTLATAGLLLAASAPLLTTTLTGPSAETVPPGQPSYAVNGYIERHYPRAVVEPATVTVVGPVAPERARALRRAIAGVEGVATTTPLARADEGVGFFTVGLRHKAVSEPAQDAVRAIRALDRPGGAELLVSGNTARFVDQKESLRRHAPLVVALVVTSTLVLLFLLTGSVLLPLKTLLMNALTLAATLGVLVLAFQVGWLHGLLGYDGPEAIEVTSLVFLFAVTFGLATDYAVLVMARIKELHAGGAANEAAVATGVARTGRVVSAAAVMIAVVFLAFAVSPVFFMKQIAIGIAVGVVIDTTIVRALLVPALMRLFGEWNWWAPGPLRRLQRRVGVGEGG